MREEKNNAERLGTIKEIIRAIIEMPKELRKLGLVYLFQWYGMFVYWQFVTPAVAKSVFGTTNTKSELYKEATTWTGLLNASYNVVTFMVAFSLVALAKKYGAKWVHTTTLLCAMVSLLMLPHINDRYLVFLPMIGFGIAWASLMGVPYIMAVRMVPSNRYGVYMGILNMMIVLPQLLETVTFGWIYDVFLDNNPTNALMFTGVLMGLGALAMTWINEPPTIRDMDDVSAPPKVAGNFKKGK